MIKKIGLASLSVPQQSANIKLLSVGLVIGFLYAGKGNGYLQGRRLDAPMEGGTLVFSRGLLGSDCLLSVALAARSSDGTMTSLP